MVEPWRVERSVYTYRDEWLKLRSDDCRTMSGHPVAPFHVLELRTWLNVVALTGDGQIVLVTEYRHGLGEVLTGLPSGTVDDGEADVEVAARRELLEETGYGGGTFYSLGNHPANPANQNNEVVGFLAVGIQRLAKQKLDPTEEIHVTTEDFVYWFDRVCRLQERIQVSHIAAALLAARLIGSGQILELSPIADRIRRIWSGSSDF